MPLGLPAKENGKYPDVAWPGCYPIFYLAVDGGCLCADCINNNQQRIERETADTTTGRDRDWSIWAHEVHWEGEPMTCDHCSAQIESAYGDQVISD